VLLFCWTIKGRSARSLHLVTFVRPLIGSPVSAIICEQAEQAIYRNNYFRYFGENRQIRHHIEE